MWYSCFEVGTPAHSATWGLDLFPQNLSWCLCHSSMMCRLHSMFLFCFSNRDQPCLLLSFLHCLPSSFSASTLFITLPALSVLAGKKFRWCTLSDLEQRKCSELSKVLLAVLPPATVNAFARVSCIRAHNTYDCIDKIRVSTKKFQRLSK